MKSKILLSFLLLFSSTGYTENMSTAKDKVLDKQEIEQLMQQYLKPKGVLNTFYDEFKFSSNQGTTFNNYSGHTNFVSAGADNLKFQNFYWGINFYNISTSTNTESRLTSILSQSHGSIENNGVFVHVMKQVFYPLIVDVFASFGKDRFKQINTINGDTANPVTGQTTYYGNDSTVGIRTFGGKSYKKLYLQGSLSYFYSNFRQPNFTLSYPGQNVFVPSLTTKVGTFVENARLYYKANQYFSPFISGGLVQIANRTFSRPLLDSNIGAAGPLPQLLLARNGYNYGVGFDYQYKVLRISPVYVHTERGSSYSDNFFGVNFQLNVPS